MRKPKKEPRTTLARLRIAREMEQRELAEKSGVGLRQIQSFESGERDLSNCTLKNSLALADALGVDPHDLLVG